MNILHLGHMPETRRLHQQWLVSVREQDDRSAFAEIYNCYWRELYIHAVKRVRDEQQAEDILQELFVQFWERRSSLDTGMNLRAYLYGMLKFKLIDFFNSNKAQQKLLDGLAEHMFDYVQQHPEEMETYLAMEKLLEEELEAMPNNMQQAVLLRWEHYSIKEIASRLNLSEQTVKNNLTEATKRLQRGLTARSKDVYGPLFLLFVQSLQEWLKP
ncbi:sigma-70 family RNA polymerase sigma factor [Sphingobacterium sp.]|uniref:RNA polymerase sigma factor n=2 Tax=unclassified Sphingobacterium TaxID=2609468 RepID=UPI0028ADB149|nr:sigma-70 family RNA polymerase sigma factor [Sphingobacterium sp.]